MKVILRGGPRDGLVLAQQYPDDLRSVRVPVVIQDGIRGQALTPEEWEDPANWEVDAFGQLRVKRPRIDYIEYHRTDAIEDGQVIFR